MTITDISTLIQNRRSIYPKSYIQGKPIDRAILAQLIENANWAPTHRLTQPWRFRVFHSAESRAKLGAYLSDFYKKNTPEDQFLEEKWKKAGENPVKSGAVIAIIFNRDAEERIPEFEEIASVAMAVQNMWLTCTAIGLGCYWSTPKAALEANTWLDLAPNESCLGLFYMGWHDLPAVPGKRDAVSEKTVWEE